MEQTGVSVTAAMEACTSMLQRMEDEEASRYTPSEVLLYQHPQHSRCVDSIGYLGETWSVQWIIIYTLQLDREGAKGSNCAASTVRIQSR